MYSLARPFLFGLDAERAHALGLKSIELAYRSGTSPLLARTSVDTMPSSVVLPAPLWPSRAHTDPARSSRLTAASARCSPKRLTRSRLM